MKLLYRDLADKIFSKINLIDSHRTFIIINGNKIYSIVWNREIKGYKIHFVCYIKYRRLTENVFVSPFILEGVLYLYYYDIKEIKIRLNEIFYEQIQHIRKARSIFKYNEPLKKMIEKIV